MNVISDRNVIQALRNTKKGRLRYDRNWEEEGRAKEIFNEISSRLSCITISPKALALQRLQDHSYCKPAPVDYIPKTEKPVRKSVETSPEKPEIEDVHYLQLVVEKALPILEYEEELNKSRQEFLAKKEREYASYEKKLLQTQNEKYRIVQQNQRLEALRKTAEFENFEALLWDCSKKTEKRNSKSEKSNVEEIKENLRKKEQEQEEMQAKLKACEENIFWNLSEARRLVELDGAACASGSYETRLAQVAVALQDIESLSTCSLISSSMIVEIEAIRQESEMLYRDIAAVVEKARQKALMEKMKAEEESAKLLLQEKQKNAAASVFVASAKTAIKTEESEKAPVQESDMDEMEECGTVNEEKPGQSLNPEREALREYCRVVGNLKDVEASLERFKTDPKHKKYRLELHKAVAINTVSDASGSQLKVKIQHLTNLFSGQTVESGGRYVSCTQDPSALSYCKSLLAEKIVTQGEEQVRSKIAAAFPFAALVGPLCAKFPDLWQLMMGHFYLRCPYLVPYYPAKQEGQSEIDYHVLLGYKYADGKLEETTNFLKRMHGFVTLYAAIIQTEPVPGKQSHGLEQAWKWMACILNIEPRPDVTATVLLAYLEVSGHALEKHYNKQFKKVLHILCKDYFHKVRQLTASGGPVGRLKEFLHSSISRGRIPPPQGILSNNFWRS